MSVHLLTIGGGDHNIRQALTERVADFAVGHPRLWFAIRPPSLSAGAP
jgi:hypothetical protein